MTTIKTEEKTVNAAPVEVFEFLGDFNNFNKLLPEDKIENWQSDQDQCSFRIKGMADIGMKIENREKPGKIEIKSHGKVPFPFTLTAHITEASEKSDFNLIFEGEINAFMKMMVEKPLTNFFNMVADNLVKVYE